MWNVPTIVGGILLQAPT